MIDITKDITQILFDLISVQSETGNEKELCDILFKTLSSFEGDLIRERDSLVLHMDFGKKKRVALVGHIDTVPVAKSSITPVFKDGELWGRGACDMKSGLACMLKVLHEIATKEITPNHNLSFVFYENEEGPLPNGVNFLIDAGHLKNIDFAFILEPTEGKYSVGCLGSLAIQKNIYGISAHSANPKNGKNAIDESMDVFKNINQMNSDISQKTSIDGLEYYETANVTVLKTDTKTFNVIPAKVEMVVNYRFSPNKNIDQAMELLKKYYGDKDLVILDQADSCYIGNKGDEFLLPTVEKEIMQAWTDIAQLNAAGIIAINYGAGSIKVAHKPDERILVEELTNFYKKLVTHL